GADHEQRAGREVDDAQHTEDERQARRDEEEQHAVRDAGEKLARHHDGVLHPRELLDDGVDHAGRVCRKRLDNGRALSGQFTTTLREATMRRTLVILALCIAPIAAQSQVKEPVKLGLIDIYSGGFAFIADSIRTGFQIAVDEANAAGGLNGRQFQVVTADMGGSVDKAVTEARRMILEEKIKYVTVGIHSGAAVAVGALGKEYKVLINGGFATTKRLTGEAGHDYVARANLSTVEIGRVMAEHLKARPDVKRVAVIAPDYEYGQHFMADFVAGLKVARPDITVVRQELHKLGATDFGPHVTALQAQPVDLVVGGMFGADLVNFLRSARDFGLFSGKTQFFTHGLDLAKMGALKDSLPPNTI